MACCYCYQSQGPSVTSLSVVQTSVWIADVASSVQPQNAKPCPTSKRCGETSQTFQTCTQSPAFRHEHTSFNHPAVVRNGLPSLWLFRQVHHDDWKAEIRKVLTYSIKRMSHTCKSSQAPVHWLDYLSSDAGVYEWLRACHGAVMMQDAPAEHL